MSSPLVYLEQCGLAVGHGAGAALMPLSAGPSRRGPKLDGIGQARLRVPAHTKPQPREKQDVAAGPAKPVASPVGERQARRLALGPQRLQHHIDLLEAEAPVHVILATHTQQAVATT